MKKGIKKVLTVLAVSAVSAFTLMVAGCNSSAGDWVQEKINQLKCEHATTRLIQQVEPTCTEKGATSGVECVDCGKVITKPDTIDAKGHNLIHYDEVKATCLLSGLSAGDYCADCDTWVKERKEIKATGHKVVELKGVAPPCTETGLSVGQGCEYCGEVYVAQEVLPALEHKLNINGECITCGFGREILLSDIEVGMDLSGYGLELAVSEEELIDYAPGVGMEDSISIHFQGEFEIYITDNMVSYYDKYGEEQTAWFIGDSIDRVRSVIVSPSWGEVESITVSDYASLFKLVYVGNA